jgi:hypothetical protein
VLFAPFCIEKLIYGGPIVDLEALIALH